MKELSPEARAVDQQKAIRQWLEVYHFLSGEALVYVLPTPAAVRLQDLTFTANVAMIPEHIPGRDVVIVSNFTSKPRVGEAAVATPFFESMGYRVYVCPHKFEGGAEIKHLHDNVYVGGFGLRSEVAAYRWMEDTFGMKVVTLKETDKCLYHLDCTVFPLTREETLVCTKAYKRSEVAALARIANRLLRRTRDFADFDDKKKIDIEVAKKALTALEVDDYGLDEMDKEIILAIIESITADLLD